MDEAAAPRTDRYWTRLQLSHPTLDPAAITEALGVQPTVSWLVGTPRQTPRGDLLEGIRRQSYWGHRGQADCADLEDAFEPALTMLTRARSFLHAFAASGGTATLSISWAYESDVAPGRVFGWDLLSRFADLKVDLGVEVHFPSAALAAAGEARGSP